MPKYTLLFTPKGNEPAQQIDCVAPNAWLALEKSRSAIGRRTIELREGSRSLGRFRHGFPSGTGVWEISPREA
uniref:hypothetical protein n=1 Tax=Altererythrobacter segetis TaxID=1104773 RepID=UPI00140DC9AA|nr:hypothetical protein [Altererythrobacter segetis]